MKALIETPQDFVALTLGQAMMRAIHADAALAAAQARIAELEALTKEETTMSDDKPKPDPITPEPQSGGIPVTPPKPPKK